MLKVFGYSDHHVFMMSPWHRHIVAIHANHSPAEIANRVYGVKFNDQMEAQQWLDHYYDSPEYGIAQTKIAIKESMVDNSQPFVDHEDLF